MPSNASLIGTVIHRFPFLASFAMTLGGLVLITCVALAARAVSPPAENFGWDVESDGGDESRSAQNSPVEGRDYRLVEGWRAYALIDDGIVPLLSGEQATGEDALARPDREQLQRVLDQRTRWALQGLAAPPEYRDNTEEGLREKA
ncbi:hypothetical protein HGRIS_014373 [Hohenbuehelia grisea]|uniref:Uncharacterized protein n=1 Tax=Hohenbuehelia grisea TaxID=104357 RepID=A0ABR3JT63_9AGAR